MGVDNHLYLTSFYDVVRIKLNKFYGRLIYNLTNVK